MLRSLMAGGLMRRFAGPLTRLIPNPYLRAFALTGAGTILTGMLRKRAAAKRVAGHKSPAR